MKCANCHICLMTLTFSYDKARTTPSLHNMPNFSMQQLVPRLVSSYPARLQQTPRYVRLHKFRIRTTVWIEFTLNTRARSYLCVTLDFSYSSGTLFVVSVKPQEGKPGTYFLQTARVHLTESLTPLWLTGPKDTPAKPMKVRTKMAACVT